MNRTLVAVAILAVASASLGQDAAPATPAAPAAAQAAPASPPPPKPATLNLFVYPGSGQDAAKQGQDENECYLWARGQTGIDPTAAPTQAAAVEAPKGGAVKGAARGAARGAVVGEVADNRTIGDEGHLDAGEGAAAGAAVGAAKGRRAEEGREAGPGPGAADRSGPGRRGEGHVQEGVGSVPRGARLQRQVDSSAAAGGGGFLPPPRRRRGPGRAGSASSCSRPWPWRSASPAEPWAPRTRARPCSRRGGIAPRSPKRSSGPLWAASATRCGRLVAMRTSVDAAGRVVIPKELRERLGIRRGRALEIRERDGRIEIEPTPTSMTLVRRSGGVVAVPGEKLRRSRTTSCATRSSAPGDDRRRHERRRGGLRLVARGPLQRRGGARAAAARAGPRPPRGVLRPHPPAPPHRAPAGLVAAFLAERFSAPPLVLPGAEHARLVGRAAETGIVGGSIHDALVGATVRHAGARLLSRDRRAVPTYERVGVEYELIG